MNPLQKHYRQPKIYIELPSKGTFYSENSLIGDALNVPIYAMTGMDELLMRTPDALFNGHASMSVIQSCCPYIISAKDMPIIDVDVVLAAIRLATFGPALPFSYRCKSCGAENEYELNAQLIIDHFHNKQFNSKLEIDGLTIYFKPLSYEQITKFNVENFTLQQMLKQVTATVDMAQKQEHLNKLYESMAIIQAEIFLLSIESIHTEDSIVSDLHYIKDWIANCDRSYYIAIKDRLDNNRIEWSVPKTDVTCTSCNTVESVEIILDQSHFFE